MTINNTRKSKKDMLRNATLEHGEIVQSEYVENNTLRYELPNGTICLRLHNTDIIKWHRNGTIELNSGTWRTKVTANRIRKSLPLPFGLKVASGEWKVSTPTGEFPFYDGIILKN